MPSAFYLGVTGHRSGMLGQAGGTVSERIEQALLTVRDAVIGWCTPDPPRLAIVSPLADGADQIAADKALALGFELHALLPFSLEETRADVPETARPAFDRLAAAARHVIELGGTFDNPLDAYQLAGRETVSRSDLLLAVWDGEAPRGKGGTGEVVELAISSGTPVIHIPIDPAQPLWLMWSGYGERRLLKQDELGDLLRSLPQVHRD